MNYQQLNRYQCPDCDKYTMRRITILSSRLHQANAEKEMKKEYKSAKGTELPAHFANAVYDEDAS